METDAPARPKTTGDEVQLFGATNSVLNGYAPQRRSRMHFALFLAGAGAFLYLRTFLLPAIPFTVTDDQSLFFARAARIVQGQVPYRDFFEIVPPGTDLIYAAGFRLLGIHAWVMPIWTITTGLAFCLVITYIAA